MQLSTRSDNKSSSTDGIMLTTTWKNRLNSSLISADVSIHCKPVTTNLEPGDYNVQKRLVSDQKFMKLIVESSENSAANVVAMEKRNRQEKSGGAIGRIASGVYVVSLTRKGKCDGMLTTWVQQTSFKPPMLMIAVQNQRPILQNFLPGEKFAVNVLSKHNMDIYKSFAKPYVEGMDRFAGLRVSDQHETGPLLLDSVAYLGCSVEKIIEAGDHCLVLGEIIDGFIVNADAEPMIHLRKNGFQY